MQFAQEVDNNTIQDILQQIMKFYENALEEERENQMNQTEELKEAYSNPDSQILQMKKRELINEYNDVSKQARRDHEEYDWYCEKYKKVKAKWLICRVSEISELVLQLEDIKHKHDLYDQVDDCYTWLQKRSLIKNVFLVCTGIILYIVLYICIDINIH